MGSKRVPWGISFGPCLGELEVIRSRVGVIFMGYSILQEILQDAVRFFESCTAKLKEVSSKSVKYEF